MKKSVYLSLVFLILPVVIATFFSGMPAIAQDAPPVAPDNAREAQPASWPDEPGAMPALIGGEKVDRPMVFMEATGGSAPQSAAASNINVWYGDSQKFGQLGNPQQWINILGNVSDTDGVKSLSYSLNGGADIPITAGPGTPANPRLVKQGDFNIEIDYADTDLNNGANTVLIKAIDNNDQLTQKSITLTYSAGNTWPLPYTANWGSSANIQDIAQVVDGRWSLQANKLIPLEVGYDRLVAIGDDTWTDYEVTVPVNVKSLDASGFEGVSNGPAIGLLMRWQGHTALNGEQPRLNWQRVGALGWYHWAVNGTEGLELRGYDYWIGTSTEKVWQFGVPYYIKMSVQHLPDPSDTRAYYRLKFWRQSDSEPVAWDLEGYSTAGASPMGSLVLVAHHVEVEFGAVQVFPLEELEFTLTTKVNGNGIVLADLPSDPIDPSNPKYRYGERVLVYALPEANNVLESWSVDEVEKSGDVNPLALYMTSDTEVTANFTGALPGSLNVTVVGEGEVTKTPDKAKYEGGEEVLLTAVPKTGYIFSQWSGDLSGSENPATLRIAGDKNVTATFVAISEPAPVSDDFIRCELNDELWDFENPAGDGSAAVIGTAVRLTVPGGASHTMWEANRNAPRIMQDTIDQDFEVVVKFDTLPTERYQLEGILVESDANNWLRFDFFNKGIQNQVDMFAGGTINGAAVVKEQTTIDVSGKSAIYMHLSRIGNTWTQSYSFDGLTRLDSQDFSQALVASRIGIFAGNESPDGSNNNAPAFVAQADYFKNTSFPAGNGGYTLDVSVVGQGIVELTPSLEAGSGYACDVEVSLNAAADTVNGWKFDGWSGDLSGQANPTTLIMDRDYMVTATFVQEEEDEETSFLPFIVRR